MAETVAETAVCDSCGVDVRDESVFCYNCGEKVKSEPTTLEENYRELAADPDKETTPAASPERPPLRSAASLRKQRRASNRQPIEVSWEPPTRPPVGFFIASIGLAVGALVLLLLALYLR